MKQKIVENLNTILDIESEVVQTPEEPDQETQCKSLVVVDDVDYIDGAGDNVTDVEVLPPQNPTRPKHVNPDMDVDFYKMRKRLDVIIERGADAIESLAALANDSEEPRAYEVLGTLIKTVAEANEKLITMHKTKKEVEVLQVKEDGGMQPVTNNAIFVGNTTELVKFLKSEKKALSEAK